MAVSLLTFGLLAVIGIFSHQLELERRNSELMEATELARGILENLKSDPSSVPPPPASFAPGDTPLAGPPAFPPAPFPYVEGDGGRYDIFVKVEAAGPPGLKAVEVRVTWHEKAAPQADRGVALQTFLPL